MKKHTGSLKKSKVALFPGRTPGCYHGVTMVTACSGRLNLITPTRYIYPPTPTHTKLASPHLLSARFTLCQLHCLPHPAASPPSLCLFHCLSPRSVNLILRIVQWRNVQS